MSDINLSPHAIHPVPPTEQPETIVSQHRAPINASSEIFYRKDLPVPVITPLPSALNEAHDVRTHQYQRTTANMTGKLAENLNQKCMYRFAAIQPEPDY